MLSISAIKSAAHGATYFEKDDYYVGSEDGGESSGQWYGKGAAGLGLSGTVDREQFKEILHGELPNGVKLGRIREGERAHSPGWDLTFSAPKSVSVAILVGGDDRLRQAHHEAVSAALDWLEKEAASTRRMIYFREVRNESTKNLVVARFDHETSREHDPQIHTHAVVANATQRKDDRWGSLDSRWLYHFGAAAGALYNTTLAIKARELGYPVERSEVKGGFELSGVDAELRKDFSQRRQQIEASLAQRGLAGPEASETAALMTRKHKSLRDRSELSKEWVERAGARLQGLEETIEVAKSSGDVRVATKTATHAVDLAIERLSEPEAAFSRAELMRWTLINGLGQITGVEAERAIKAAQRDGHIGGTSMGPFDAYTTPMARETEKRVTDAVKRGHHTRPRMVPERELKAALEPTTLTRGQRDALTLIARNQDRFVGVIGRPGTGKSYLMGHARELLEAQGWTVLGAAQNAKATEALKEGSGIESQTLAARLGRALRDAKAARDGNAIAGAIIKAKYEKQVWVVDEASQIDNKSMRNLTSVVERLGFRVVLVGDPEQLGAIAAGKPMQLMLDAGMKSATMDEIQRQKRPEDRDAVLASINKDHPRALAIHAHATRELPERERRLDAMLSDWKSMGDERANTLMLTAGGAEKVTLNEGARAILRKEGRLAGEVNTPMLYRVFSRKADRVDASLYQANDVILFTKAVQALGIERGDYWSVVGQGTQDGTIVLKPTHTADTNRQIEWNPERLGTGARKGVELFRVGQSSIAPGEKIRWTRNDNTTGLRNGQVVSVTAINEASLTVKTEKGEIKQLSPSELKHQHWDHHYASTVYSSQGATVKHVLVNAEGSRGELFSQKAFLVAISRHKESLRLYADNLDGVEKNLKRFTGDKTSALESLRETKETSLRDTISNVLEGLEALTRKAIKPTLPRQATIEIPVPAIVKSEVERPSHEHLLDRDMER